MSLYKIIDKRNDECIGVRRCAMPFQEWFFVPTDDLDFLQMGEEEIEPAEYDTLLSFHHETGELYLK